ncbi:unnamed protein product [Candidula unifasciata]|uniref:Uncharacterized protein n=1 Tax=Candidula unifasciata TaxID=100452 RepID=A0A8S3ZAQ2_9EUPU|nr:unnamed protein product [Candidula unifasciata]
MSQNIPLFSMLSCFLLLWCFTAAQNFGRAQLVYEWKWIDFDWPSAEDERNARSNGSFVPERNLFSGIKEYKGTIYISIPRRKWTAGQPVSLARVVTIDGLAKLRPYPNWTAQQQGDCAALQFVQSMEIDPNTGFMYVIDTGRVGLSLNLCPAKLVVYDLKIDTQIDLYEFPTHVVSNTSNFLNDIVLDYVNGQVRYAYITDTNDASIVVYDFHSRSSWKLKDPTMGMESNGTVITISGIQYNFPIALNGIAMSPDFKYVYYCSLGGYNLYQIPTETLRNPGTSNSNGIRLLGKKVSQTDGMIHGSKFLYYGAVGLNAVYFWNATKDMAEMNVGIGVVTLNTQTELIRNDSKLQWPSTFAFDDQGWLWIACNRLQVFWNADNPPDDGEAYMRIWKVYVNETGYLYQAHKIEQGKSDGSTLTSSTTDVDCFVFLSVMFLCCLKGYY